jgi:hypothetical protein
METTYSKPALVTALVVCAVVILAALWWLVKNTPAPQSITPQTPPSLSEQEKVQILKDLAASSGSSPGLPMETKEQILHKAATVSGQSDSPSAETQRKLEVVHALGSSQ